MISVSGDLRPRRCDPSLSARPQAGFAHIRGTCPGLRSGLLPQMVREGRKGFPGMGACFPKSRPNRMLGRIVRACRGETIVHPHHSLWLGYCACRRCRIAGQSALFSRIGTGAMHMVFGRSACGFSRIVIGGMSAANQRAFRGGWPGLVQPGLARRGAFAPVAMRRDLIDPLGGSFRCPSLCLCPFSWDAWLSRCEAGYPAAWFGPRPRGQVPGAKPRGRIPGGRAHHCLRLKPQDRRSRAVNACNEVAFVAAGGIITFLENPAQNLRKIKAPAARSARNRGAFHCFAGGANLGSRTVSSSF